MSHTKLPWSVGHSISGVVTIDDKNNHLMQALKNPEFGSNDLSEANAAFIVKAVNNHENLLDALKDIARGQLQVPDFERYAKNVAARAIKQAEES